MILACRELPFNQLQAAVRIEVIILAHKAAFLVHTTLEILQLSATEQQFPCIM
jgi:hypothetical protein